MNKTESKHRKNIGSEEPREARITNLNEEIGKKSSANLFQTFSSAKKKRTYMYTYDYIEIFEV